MKRMKKLLAWVLALAMIVTVVPSADACAAVRKPALSAKTLTLTAGQKKTLKVVRAGKNAVRKWSSSKTSVATVSKKGVVKAVKAGKATVTCKVTTKAGKTYKLTCKVTVAKNVTSQTVASQKELNKALKNKNLKKLTVATTGAVTFTIPAGDYSKTDLVVNAPNADVVNNGTFHSITIQAVKADTYRENAKGNTITVSSAADVRVIVAEGASVSGITIAQSGGTVRLVVDGAVAGIRIDAPAAVAVEGSATTAVPVEVSEKAAGATVTSSTPVDVKTAAEISLTLTKGAEGSKVETTSDKAGVTVKNETTQAVAVKTTAGSKDVAANSSSKVDHTGTVTDVTNNSNNSNSGTVSGGGSSSGGSSSPMDGVEITNTYIKSSKQIAVYFSREDLVDISKANVKVTDAQGTEQTISEAYRHEEDTNSYWINFAEALPSGSYQVTITVAGKTFETSFKMDASVWKNLDAADAVLAEQFKTVHQTSVTGLKSTEICRSTFEADLLAAISADADAKAVDRIVVQTRPFTYDGDVEENHTVVSIWVGIYKGEAVYMRNDFAEFACTGDAVVAPDPTIYAALADRVVVTFEEGFEYACAEADMDVSEIPEDEWFDGAYDVDECGNHTFYVDADREYVVYARVPGVVDEDYGKTSVTPDPNQKYACSIKVGSGTETNFTEGSVTTSGAISIPLKDISTCTYGPVDDTDGYNSRYGIEAKNPSDFQWDMQQYDDDGNVLITIDLSVGQWSKGTNTITFDLVYRYGKDGDNEVILAEAKEKIPFTITFTVE